MAAAAIHSIIDSLPNGTLGSTGCTSAHKKFQTVKEDRLERMDALSPAHRSCIKLSSVEPCVNRVVFHLNTLKQHLDECDIHDKVHDRRREMQPKSVIFGVNKDSRVMAQDSPVGGLVIEGVSTGVKLLTPQKAIEKLDGSQMIDGAIMLVTRLEQDRQETLTSLMHEKEKVESLSQNLNRECERRLSLLPTIVQSEHDELLRDLIELRWHVNFDRRQLDRIKDDLKLSRLRNNHLRESVNYYKESCPLLDEKLMIENVHISEIACDQQETLDKLNRAKHLLSQTEDRSVRAHKHARIEKENMANKLEELALVLVAAQSKLKQAAREAASIAHHINDSLVKISDNNKRIRSFDEKLVSVKSKLSQFDSRVAHLREKYSAVENNHLCLKHRLETLHKKRLSEQSTLEAERLLLLEEMQNEDLKLKEARDFNEDLQQSVDSLRESIAILNKQTQDDEKSVERARRELVKLDEQMGVSVAQFTKVREEHIFLSEQLKTDEANAGNIEHALRTKFDAIKQQIKDEGKTRIIYDGKVQASSAELDKIRAECKQQADKAQSLAHQSQNQSQSQTEIVNELEKQRSDQICRQELLVSQVLRVQSEHNAVKTVLGEKFDVLSSQEKSFSEEMQSKISRVETISERIRTLKRKIEDTLKSTNMLNKMEVSTSAIIDQLELELQILKGKFSAEKEEEQRCKQEYREIANFSVDAEKKHSQYINQRLELLEQCRVDLFKAHALNLTLAKQYRSLQYEAISRKTSALNVVEKKLEMEESLRDHKQLVAFQSCIYSAMKMYYEHRGKQGWRDVAHFHHESIRNARYLKLLQSQFKTVIELMNEFLEHGLV